MAGSIVRLRSAAAAVVGRRHFASSYSSPCLMLPPDKMYSVGEKKVVNLNVSSEIKKELKSDWVVGSSHGWVSLLKYSEKDLDMCSLSLWNPMSGSRVKLPPLPDIPYNEPQWGTTTLVVGDAECRRAVLMGTSPFTLCACCPDQCNEWSLFGPNPESFDYQFTTYHDVVVSSQNRVYSLDECEHRWKVVRWDISDPWKPRIEWEWDDKCLHKVGGGLLYAEHSGQIFMVASHQVPAVEVEDWWISGYINPMKTVSFDVHLLVENENAVRHMDHSLDGLVMFVGLDNSFAVAAADYPHLKPDSIYFTDSFGWDDDDYGAYKVGIYDYKNKTLSACYYPADYHQPPHRARPHPFWLTPTR